MTRFIFKYLSAHFILKFGKIVPANKLHPYYYEIDNLIAELSKVFGLTRKQLKYYIKGWILKQDRNFDFKEYWVSKPVETPDYDEDAFGNIAFPIIQRVAARTIANDLVAVQPMDMPSGRLFYFDIQVGGQAQHVEERNRNGRVYPREVLNNAIQNPLLAELDHGSATDRLFNDWATTRMNQAHSETIRQLYRNQLAHLQRTI